MSLQHNEGGEVARNAKLVQERKGIFVRFVVAQDRLKCTISLGRGVGCFVSFGPSAQNIRNLRWMEARYSSLWATLGALGVGNRHCQDDDSMLLDMEVNLS